jgi:hypothetical protein
VALSEEQPRSLPSIYGVAKWTGKIEQSLAGSRYRGRSSYGWTRGGGPPIIYRSGRSICSTIRCSEHPHGITDHDFDGLFTTDKPVIFADHGYPWLIHRLTYRRTNHHKDLDRFHRVSDVIDRVPKLGYLAAYAKQEMRDKLIEHEQYITRYGDDMPEVKQWRWPEPAAA